MKNGLISIVFFCIASSAIGQTIQPSKEVKTNTTSKEKKGIETTAKPLNSSNAIQKPRTIDKVRLKKLPIKKDQEIREPLKHD